LANTNLIESLYTEGIALYASFSITAFFVAISFLVHFKKQGYNQALQSALSSNGDAENKTSANVKGCVGTLTSLQTAMKSGLAGFSFGSEFFLITGLLKDAPHLAAIMIVFRCLHIIVTGMFVSILFGSDENAQWLEQKGVVKNAQTMHLLLNEKFSRGNMPFVSGIVLLAFFDCSLLQFLPWNASEMYKESQGFPSLTVLKWALGTDTMQATASVITQIYFLATSANLNEPTTTAQAKALFGLNISFAVIGAVSGLVTLCLKNGLLSRLEKEQDAQKDKSGSENGIEAHYESDGGTMQSSFTENPMLSSMGDFENEDVKQMKEKIAELEAESKKLQSKIRKLKSTNEGLESEVHTIKAENQTLQSKVEHLESEVHELRTEYGAQL
jgi:archaellum component FlaC